VPISLPPLRERKEDIPILVEHFLKRFNKENNKNVSISSEAMKFLSEHSWPGNVRELENTMERLVIMSGGDIITSSDLPINLRLQTPRSILCRESLRTGIEDIERSSILDALEKSDWVQARAARMLGLTPRQVGYKMKKYALKPSHVA
jgi:Nif-specific regulatory protein